MRPGLRSSPGACSRIQPSPGRLKPLWDRGSRISLPPRGFDYRCWRSYPLQQGWGADIPDALGRTIDFTTFEAATSSRGGDPLVHSEALSRLLRTDSRTAEDLEAQHSIAYVLKGSARSTARRSAARRSRLLQGRGLGRSGPGGAAVWRWELVRTDAPNNLAWGDGIASRLRMSRRIRMFELVPTSKWLFRLDCIYNNRGSTGLHSHPGSGIRCMLEGHLRVESDKGECSDNSAHRRLLVRGRAATR